jgi:serine/threonine protein kinase
LNETLTAATDPFASSLTGRKLGRYEVLARLASGGMAGVYVARALGVAGFERLVAVKVLHPHLAHEEEFISMFLDEARLAARIRHPNVVPTIDISDTPDAGFYLVMEYIEGDHLGALLQKAWKLGKRVPFSVTLRIIVDALEGLGAAHNLTDEAGRPLQLVHRDVSPHNIMVSTDGVARITDFGVAKAEVRLSTTREGQFKGKLAYMAPEHASNGEADQRSDLFSMAIILWESLAGKRLFRAENHAATLNKICLEPIPMPSSVDPALAPFDPILERGLARDPHLRYQTAEEFAEAIEEMASSLGGLAKQREVAQLVREYAAEKLQKDADLIRDAIAQLAALEVPSEAPPGMSPVFASEQSSPPPPPPVALPPPRVFPAVAPALPEAITFDLSPDPSPRSQRRWLWAGLLLALAAVIGASVMLSMREDQITPVPLQTTPSEIATPTPPPPPPADPAPAPPAAEVTPPPPEPVAKPERPRRSPSASPSSSSSISKATPAPSVEAAEPSIAPVATPAPAPVPPRRKPREGEPGSDTPVARPVPDDLLLNPYR